ncbi:MAG: hypothetical protein ABFC24_11010 [Methanoregulaceae archaeon]
MLEFLKGLMKKKEKEPPRLLTFGEIPGWMDDIDLSARQELDTATDAARTHIEALRKSLLAQVKDLKVPEEKRHLHPKLEKVALSTLPLFERSMSQTLAKPFPAGTDEFYVAAGECLKTCLKTMQGQGRYLQAVFPEEMKGIRGTLKDFGHEINALTEATKKFRDHGERVQGIRKIYDALVEIRDSKTGSGDRHSQIVQRIADAKRALDDFAAQRVQLEKSPEYLAYLKLKEQIHAIEEKRDTEMREFTVISAVIAHVFRKAEKVEGRKGDGPSAKAVRQATDLLSDHQIPRPDELAAALRISFPVVLPLIKSGEVPLKNKEERTLFSDTDHLSEVLGKCVNAYHEYEVKIAAMNEELEAGPVRAQITRLETEKRQTEKTMERSEAQIADLAKYHEEAAEAVPTLAGELDRTIGEFSKGSIRVQPESCNSIITTREKSV